MQVCIGDDAGNHVIIRVLTAPDASEEWGFLNAEIDIQAGFWRGVYQASLQAGDFPPFRKQLQAMYEWRDDKATFTTMEGWLEMNLTLNHLGHVHLEGTAIDCLGTGNTLAFHLALDQSYLPRIIDELQSIERSLMLGG